jgi:nucleotide-binding universal stress UspA family protein
MTNNAFEPICINRILIPLDTSSHSFAALQAAVNLAHHYQAKLRGIFIEDITLLSLAEMPFRQEVGEYTAIIREISTDGMTRGIFVQSKTVVKTFQNLIRRTDLEGDIAILRGKVNEIIKSEASQCDLLILGKSGTNPSSIHRMGSTTRAMIRDQKVSLLLIEEGNQLGHPIFVLFDNSPLGATSLETAGDLLEPGQSLVILLNNDNDHTFEENRKFLRRWSSEKQINISIQGFKPRSFDQFVKQFSGLKTGLFVLPKLEDIKKRWLVEICLEEVTLPVLLIQTPVSD